MANHRAVVEHSVAILLLQYLLKIILGMARQQKPRDTEPVAPYVDDRRRQYGSSIYHDNMYFC